MRTELPPYVVWGIVGVLVLVVGFLLYRAWTGGVHTYGENTPKPAPGVSGSPMPGAPGGNPQSVPMPVER